MFSKLVHGVINYKPVRPVLSCSFGFAPCANSIGKKRTAPRTPPHRLFQGLQNGSRLAATDSLWQQRQLQPDSRTRRMTTCCTCRGYVKGHGDNICSIPARPLCHPRLDHCSSADFDHLVIHAAAAAIRTAIAVVKA